MHSEIDGSASNLRGYPGKRDAKLATNEVKKKEKGSINAYQYA